MLNWDDEELARILWEDLLETEDHIVPYTEGHEGSLSAEILQKNELNKGSSSHGLEIKRSEDKYNFHGWGNETNASFNSKKEKNVSRLGNDPWTDPKLSAGVKRDHGSMGTNLADKATGTHILSSSGAGPLEKDSKTSRKLLEEQENIDFIDYSWADIGSFDDLDKIFSNDDPIFGNAGLGNVDEMWSSPKGAEYSLGNSSKSLPESNKNATEHIKSGTEYTHNSNRHISGQVNKMESTSFSDVDVPTDGSSYAEEKGVLKFTETKVDRIEKDTKLSSPDLSRSALNELSNKMIKQKKIKNHKSLHQKTKGNSLLSSYGSQNLPGNEVQQYGKQEATSLVHSYPFSEPNQLNHCAFQPGSTQFSVISRYDNVYNKLASMPMLPQLHCDGGSFQQRFPGCEVSHGSSHQKTSYAPLKPRFMTPQEKIYKLRMRQQMQAMLAIKKQQRVLSHQSSGLDTDRSLTKQHSHDTRIETADGIENNNEETPTFLPSFDPSSRSEKKFSTKTAKGVNEFLVEDSPLSQLQDIISKLDSRVRLCIRDSLFRLASSAAQKHYPSDISSDNNNNGDEDHELAKDRISSHTRSAVMVDAETDTNPVDRMVAHLLFHRPFDVNAKHSERLELPVSTQCPPECITDSVVYLPTGCSKISTETKQSLAQKGAESSLTSNEPLPGTELLDSSGMNISENASKNEPQNSGTTKIPNALNKKIHGN